MLGNSLLSELLCTYCQDINRLYGSYELQIENEVTAHNEHVQMIYSEEPNDLDKFLKHKKGWYILRN